MPVSTSSGPLIVVVGASLQDRADALGQVAHTLEIGGPVALLLLSIGGWLVVGAACARSRG